MSLGKAMIHARKPKANRTEPCRPHESPEPNEGWPGQRVSSAYTMQKPVLVLNASYEPINICGARRALDSGAQGCGQDGRRTGSHSHAPCCASLCLRLFACSSTGVFRTRRVPSCARTSSCATATVANTAGGSACRGTHARPRAAPVARRAFHLGKSGRLLPLLQPQKGNHLLSELNDIKLLREPRPFSLHTSRHIMRMIGHSDQKWRKYLYYELLRIPTADQKSDGCQVRPSVPGPKKMGRSPPLSSSDPIKRWWGLRSISATCLRCFSQNSRKIVVLSGSANMFGLFF